MSLGDKLNVPCTSVSTVIWPLICPFGVKYLVKTNTGKSDLDIA